MKRICTAIIAAATFASAASATFITSLPGGQSAGIPAANEMTAGLRIFGTAPNLITYSASQNMALYGWTGSYTSDSFAWNAGGAPIIGNNIFTPSTITLRFAVPITAFLAEMNWERQFGSVVTFAALDFLGNDIETATLNDGTGVVASQLHATGGSYGIQHASADIYGIRLSNGALGIRNLSFATSAATTPVPEPASWAMMVLGFAVLGAGMRGAQRRSALI